MAATGDNSGSESGCTTMIRAQGHERDQVTLERTILRTGLRMTFCKMLRLCGAGRHRRSGARRAARQDRLPHHHKYTLAATPVGLHSRGCRGPSRLRDPLPQVRCSDADAGRGRPDPGHERGPRRCCGQVDQPRSRPTARPIRSSCSTSRPSRFGEIKAGKKPDAVI